ncbi:hypothetical protein ZIOFF_057614 [Zingiber officinale]|uniref:Uncharacterized protein n=1 Tax=Zingiber officinale TaxID=94328 RepID=A0A8J5KL59_ZINOF|nr:hypothetical protein ZIOFF_057614 [Zingiber officinale]
MGLIEKLYLNLLSYSSPGWAAAIGGALVVITLFLSMFLLFQHLSSYKNPEEQKFLVGVILMVPCYSVESDFAIISDYLRCSAVGGEERTIEFLNRQDELVYTTPGHFIQMIIKTFTAILAVVLEAFGVYCEGEFKWKCGLVVPVQMFIASIVHLYVFPAEPYKLMGERITSGVAVLGDYASLDCPLDPDEVRDSERPIKLRLPQPDLATKSSTAIRESVRDVFVGGGEYIVNDLKFTVTHAVEPMEKGFTRFNRKLHRFSENIRKHEKGKLKTKDDSSMGSSSLVKRVRGIDDPLLNGSVSDSAAKRGRRQVKESGNKSAESGGENSDTGHGGFEVHGCRWITKD